jgi:hypothetical protein
MPAIITDQFRILNTETFVQSFTGIGITTNYYYSFLAHPNPTNTNIENYGASDWQTDPPEPKDSFRDENSYFDSMLFLKKITSNDVARIIPRINWESGVSYDMYRNNYNIDNPAPQTDAKTLYESRFYVINSEYKVYICLNNGSNPEYPNGQKSLYEPTFVDTNPQQAGDDGYLWKYLYTILPSDILKFTTENYIPVPKTWGDPTTESIKNSAVNGKIQTVIIKNRGLGYTLSGGGGSTGTITDIPILGDGTGGSVSITINGGEIDTIQVTNGGSNYTRGFVNFGVGSAGIPEITGGSGGSFEVIIPPIGGHGFDIYKELGSYRVMVYSKYDSDPDYVIGNNFSRIGIIKNPVVYGSQVEPINTSTATNLGALKLKPVGAGNTSDTSYPTNALITQSVGVGSTAVGYVASWDGNTGILKYYQPVGLSTLSTYGYKLNSFVGSGTTINCSTVSGSPLIVDTSFGGDNIQVGGKVIQLGQTFSSGISNPDIKKYYGEIIYIDNRAPITRSASQKEELKIVVEF